MFTISTIQNVLINQYQFFNQISNASKVSKRLWFLDQYHNLIETVYNLAF
jgi:hypothetical protein